MRARFLAIQAANPKLLADLVQSASIEHDLFTIMHRPDLVILSGRDDAVAMGVDDGVSFGRIFSRTGTPAPLNEISTAASSAIVTNGPQYLLARYWGGYVAFFERPGRGWTVLRDPSGEVPCYFWRSGEALIITSHLELGEFAGARPLSIDWPSLARQLRRLSAWEGRTALGGVSELLAGECLRLGPSIEVSSPWSPWDYCGTGKSQHDAQAALGAVIDACVHAWAHSFDRVCLRLSGGLDSSIIAASLKEHSDIHCLNLLSPSPTGDERRFAQAVADHLGLGLVIHPFAVDDVDLGQIGSRWEPRPAGRLVGQAGDAPVLGLLGDCPNAAAFTGEGGDNVFCFLQSPLPVLDRLLIEGPGGGAWRTWRDTRQLTQASVWTSGSWLMRRMIAGPKKSAWMHNDAMLAPAARDIEDREAPRSAWMSRPHGVLPAKAAHVMAIFRAQARSRELPDGRSVISPLLSQPIVETALAIPAWQWCEGGIDRALVRNAFADRLPPVIARRRWKGGPEGFGIALVAALRVALREHLLDGILARQGILDRQAVDAALSGDDLTYTDQYLRILELAEAEGWARHWDGSGRASPRESGSSASKLPNVADRPMTRME